MDKHIKIAVIFGIVVVSFSVFYVFVIRPFNAGRIRKKCYKDSLERAIDTYKTKAEFADSEIRTKMAEKDAFSKDDLKSYYDACLTKYGLME